MHSHSLNAHRWQRKQAPGKSRAFCVKRLQWDIHSGAVESGSNRQPDERIWHTFSAAKTYFVRLKLKYEGLPSICSSNNASITYGYASTVVRRSVLKKGHNLAFKSAPSVDSFNILFHVRLSALCNLEIYQTYSCAVAEKESFWSDCATNGKLKRSWIDGWKSSSTSAIVTN